MCKDDKLLIDNKTDELIVGGMENGRLRLDDPLKIKKSALHFQVFSSTCSVNMFRLFARLNARMITPNTHYGPIPEPKFIGYQELFKDFIDLSSCPEFHQCLKDFIANEIETVGKTKIKKFNQ